MWAAILGAAGGPLLGWGQWLVGSILVGATALLMLIGLISDVMRDITHMKSRNMIVLLALMCGSFFLLRSGIAWEMKEWFLPLIAGIMLFALAELIARIIVIFRSVLAIF